jgi:hypothetical protein
MDADRPVVVVASQVGWGLCNRMLLFAHLIGAAIEHDLLIVNPGFGLYADLFPSTAKDLLCRFPAEDRLPPSAGGREALMAATLAGADALHGLQLLGRDVGLIRLEREEYVDLNSDVFLGMVRRHGIVVIQDWFFRNAANTVRHRDAICNFFTPDARVLERAQALVRGARASGKPVVGVHVRRNDYERYRGGEFYFSHADYRRIMRVLEPGPDGTGVSFFVCSDEPIPSELVDDLDVTLGSGRVLEDLYGLAACDFLIGPPSTFSRWAAFYGEVPLYRMHSSGDDPSYDLFSTGLGLGSGRRERAWIDPATG